jgi:hypothetical protein
MRPPAPMTPTRSVSLAPRTRVEARAVIPVAMMKWRRFIGVDMASILGQENGKWKIEIGKWESETRNSKLETRNSKLETRNSLSLAGPRPDSSQISAWRRALGLVYGEAL